MKRQFSTVSPEFPPGNFTMYPVLDDEGRVEKWRFIWWFADREGKPRDWRPDYHFSCWYYLNGKPA